MTTLDTSTNTQPIDRDRLYADAVDQYGAALARLVMGYEANMEQRRDLLQEIHLALWTSFARFDGRCALKTWVYRVGHNVAINHAIKDKRLNERFQTGIEELTTEASQADSSIDLDQRNALERLQALIQKLKAPDRQIILLYLDDVDATTIAQITGLSSANVATKVHRIKQLLVRHFKSRGETHVRAE